jgi:hypothetical protein
MCVSHPRRGNCSDTHHRWRGSADTLSAQPNSEVAFNYIENQVLLYGSLYHDARSAGFHTHHNVVIGGPMWLYLQCVRCIP